MLIKKQVIFSFIVGLWLLPLSAQTDFNNFKNLQAVGDIPDDFTENTFKKINHDIESGELKLKGNQEKIFLEGVHYAVNDLLQSGMVVYGDEVTAYINKIAAKLLAKEDHLIKKIRFYTIKSNETNAFSTFQGIIFVTTGLISQLTNEAQLAYVLSHEIAHYTEEHAVQTFDYHVKNQRNSDKIQALSKFSKENELEADRLGLKRYYEAGYSKDELISTFDVLLYSYLPFEEIEFSKTYLNSELITIPEGFYPKTNFEIKAIEDTDDSQSSHPNVKKRKEAAKKELDNYPNWGNSIYTLGEDQFKYIRTLCRFESIRTDVIDGEFDDALYSILILEKEYPTSIYLKQMKAKCWLGIAQYSLEGKFNRKLPKEKKMEGQIATLQYLLRELDRLQILTLSMRMIEDARQENPEDLFIKLIWERMVKTLSKYNKFNLDNYSAKTYQTAYQEFLNLSKNNVKDSVQEKEENLTKYERIKRQNSSAISFSDFDSSKFYLYALTDLKTSELFKSTYTAFKDEIDALKEKEENYNNLSSKDKKKLKKKEAEEAKNASLSSFIYLEPIVYSYNSKGVDRVKSEKLQIEYSNAIVEIADQLNKNVTVMSSVNLHRDGTELYNNRAVLMSYFFEIIENEELDLLPTDYSLLQKIKDDIGTDKVLLSILEHENSPKISALVVMYSMWIYPVLLWYIPSAIMKSNEIQYTSILINISTGKIEKKIFVNSYESINKYTIAARVYNLFFKL